MILLAFFLPLALYLLLLGFLNRQRHPLLVSGVWDGIGLVFGVSGFLLFTGPVVFSSLRERWRLFWLLGKGETPVGDPYGAWQLWIFLSILYFLFVVVGVAIYFWRQRPLTAVYNADALQVEQILWRICERLALNPARAGNLFLFGLNDDDIKKIQTAHSLPNATIPKQTAILEVDSFPLMRHVTLRWEPVDAPLRALVENELAEQLEQTAAEDNPLSGWLLTLGCLLLFAEMAGVFLVVLMQAFRH